jgi:purine-binding chemotaxis protein CheW
MIPAADRAAIDRILAERARLLTQPIVTEVAVASVDLIAFSAGNERYAIAAPFVQRLERLDRITPLPGAAAHFTGIINVHGQLMALIDLRLLLGGAPCTNASFAVVVGAERTEFGIIAESLLDLQPVPLDTLHAPDGARAIVQRLLPDGTAVIDGPALLADPRLIAGEETTR